MISTLPIRFTDSKEKSSEVISAIFPNEICVEIFLRLAGTFEESNLYKLGQCHLTSKRACILTEPVWRAIRQGTGMNVSFQVCYNTKFPEAYGWMLNKQVLVLIHKLFLTRGNPLPEILIKQIKQNRETLLQETSFLLKKSRTLSNRFFTIASEENSQSVLSFFNKQIMAAVSYIFPIIQTPDVGEQILQIFVDAKQSEKFELNLDNLKIIVEHNPDALPFMMKILLSLHCLCFPAMRLVLDKGIELWKSGKKSHLEIMLLDLWKFREGRLQCTWLYNFLKDAIENPKTQIPPVRILFQLVYLHDCIGMSGLEITLVVDPNGWFKGLINSIVAWVQNLSISDTLEEKSYITTLFLPLLSTIHPKPNSVLMFETKQKIRSQHYDEAEELFKNYLKAKYLMNLNDVKVEEMTDDELEIFHFLQLKKADQESVQRAYEGYFILVKKTCKNTSDPLSQKLYIRYSLALIEAEMKLGKSKEAKDRSQKILDSFFSTMSKHQSETLCRLCEYF